MDRSAEGRESPHYMQGLNFLVTNQLDLAIEELGQARALAPDALEIHMILGNLYREKGQVSRAVQVHQHLLQRPAWVGSSTPRAALPGARLSPRRLRRSRDRSLHGGPAPRSEQRARAAPTREAVRGSAPVGRGGGDSRTARGDPGPAVQARHHTIQAFLENELGVQAREKNDHAGAARHFPAAIDLDPRVAPAYLNLGDLRQQQGDLPAAVGHLAALASVAPERAYLVFDRLRQGYDALGDTDQLRRVLPVADRGGAAGLAGAPRARAASPGTR